MENKLRRLADMLTNVDSGDFHYDSYHSGVLEESLVQSQIEVCHKIAEYIIEILDEKEEVEL